MSLDEDIKARRGYVTVKDLARDLGLSVSTVSRAFYPKAAVAKKTRAAVLKRAKEVGYRTNVFAKSLVTKNTQIVGVVASDLTNPYYPEVMTELTAMLQQQNINVMLSTATEPDQIDVAVEVLLSYQPGVIIILAANCASAARQKCEAVGIPCIFFNRLSSDGLGIGISCDNIEGGVMAADFLIERAHVRLGYVSAFPGASTNQERQEGFCRRVVERGLETPVIFEAGAFNYEKGYEAAKALKALSTPPTAVFCANDIVALGFIEGATVECGLEVPRNLSVIGFDNIQMAGWSSHNLTTIAQPTKKMLIETVGLIKKIIRRRYPSDLLNKTIRISPGPVIERLTAARSK